MGDSDTRKQVLTGGMPTSKDEFESRHSKFWGKPSDSEKAFNQELQQKQADIAEKMLKMTTADWKTRQPLYEGVVGRGLDFLNGDLNPASHPWFESGKSTTEEQYSVAKDQLLANVAQGGAIDEGLADIEAGRAKSLTDMMTQIAMDEYNKVYGIASGAPAQAYMGLSGTGAQFGNAASNYNQYLSGQQQAASQNAQGAGSAIGMMMAK